MIAVPRGVTCLSPARARNRPTSECVRLSNLRAYRVPKIVVPLVILSPAICPSPRWHPHWPVIGIAVDRRSCKLPQRPSTALPTTPEHAVRPTPSPADAPIPPTRWRESAPRRRPAEGRQKTRPESSRAVPYLYQKIHCSTP